MHSFLLARLRTATLRHDDEGQVNMHALRCIDVYLNISLIQQGNFENLLEINVYWPPYQAAVCNWSEKKKHQQHQ